MEIKGLKSRVTIGFMSIVSLLFLSGMLSFFELNTLSEDTDLILSANKRNMELSQRMLHSLQKQNYAFVKMVAFGDRGVDSLALSSIDELNKEILEAKGESESGIEILDSMLVATSKLKSLTQNLISSRVKEQALLSLMMTDTLLQNTSYRKIYSEYQPLYSSVLNAIDSYLNMSQQSLAPRAESLHHNAYRAVTPVFISLVVMIVIVLLLYYFMMLYCVRPVVEVNKSLADYLNYKVPYAPKSECRDEMLALKDNIEILINISKKSKA